METSELIAYAIAGATAVWALFAGKVTPFWLKHKEDTREFAQSMEETALAELQALIKELSQQTLRTNHDLTDDLINTKNVKITELRLAIIGQTEEIVSHIKVNSAIIAEQGKQIDILSRRLEIHTNSVQQLAAIVAELRG